MSALKNEDPVHHYFMSSTYNSLFLLSVSVLLFLFTGLSGCSGTDTVTEEPAAEQRDLSALEELYWERMEQSRMNFTQADVDFMEDMIVHHAQALVMSRLAPDNDASRSVQILASRIINAQDDEIKLMQNWLRDRNQPVPLVQIEGIDLTVHLEDDNETDGHDHHGHGHHGHEDHGHNMMHDHHDMPGMLTQEQLEELAAAHGTEFDRKFLKFMIEHHEGAVIMVQELFGTDGAALDREIFDLASGIHAEQVTEIERMRLMLENMNQ